MLGFDESWADSFGKLRGRLNRIGTQGNPVDVMIAAVALAYDLTIVSHNTQHSQSIPGLRMEDWLAPSRPRDGVLFASPMCIDSPFVHLLFRSAQTNRGAFALATARRRLLAFESP